MAKGNRISAFMLLGICIVLLVLSLYFRTEGFYGTTINTNALRITKHITFFYIENRIQYINNIINETNTYENRTDIYIHTNNKELTERAFTNYTNGSLNIIYHDLSNEHPYYLTWKCRDLLKAQRNDYDIFMYIEDDILVPYKAIQYWLRYNEKVIEHGYNLGFVRIELGKDSIEYITDLLGEHLDTVITLDNDEYCVNNKNTYCGFWIYNKNEFNRFASSKFYDPSTISGYDIREQSAIGLHGKSNDWYKNTVIPIINNKLIEDCKIYHMPNTYVNDSNSLFATIPFNTAIKLNTV